MLNIKKHARSKMAGYVIHLAVGKIYIQNNEINNLSEFEKGIIAPDMEVDKSKSHYGPYSSKPNLKKYIEMNRNFDEFKEGYFLHLITDYLFYNRFLTRWSSEIYEDYDKLNNVIIKKYGIIVPKEIQDIVNYKKGKPKVLDENRLYRFIDSVGKINIREMLLKKDINFEKDFYIEF